MSVLARLVPDRADRPASSGPRESGPRRWLTGAWRWCVTQVATYQWWIVAAAGVVAFVLGCIGWWKFQCAKHPTAGDPAYIAYWSLKDFLINSPSEQVIPWELNVARFLAPLVAGWAGYSALAVLFRDRIQQMRIPWMRQHVVVCGLGKYVGTIFVRHLHENGIRVVVVEQNITNPNIDTCRGLGVPVVIGDAQREKTLQAAGAHHARRVLAVTDDDAVNTQITATWRNLPRRRSAQAGCLARISDTDFCSVLRLPQTRRRDAPWADFFNIDEIGAREILQKFSDPAHPSPHILVAHLDPLGIWLVWHAARAWYEHGDKTTPLLVTVIDHDPGRSIEALKGQHPALKKHCEFKAFYATAEDIHEQLPAHHRDPATPPISCAYVTAYQDRQAFSTAVKLHDELHQLEPPVHVVLALSRPKGISDLVENAQRIGGLHGLEVFSTLEKACSVDVLEGGSLEPLAEAIHERWLAEQRRDGNPLLPWDELDQSRKESNREQARDIASKLNRIGCEIALLRDWDAGDFTISAEEVERLAVEEHERWRTERLGQRWKLIAMPKGADDREVKQRLAEAKQRKQSPYLISWENLERDYPKIANYDRMFVREIPALLASAGLQAVRKRPAAPESVAPQPVSADGALNT